jgi:hypothetical protein
MEVIFVVTLMLAVISAYVGVGAACDENAAGVFALSGVVVLFIMIGLAMASEQKLCYLVEAEIGKPVKACDARLDREEGK